MKDMFGNQIEVGQHVLYADEGDNDKPALYVYRIKEYVSPDICVAELLDGTGNWYYLEDTWQRCAVIGNKNELCTLANYHVDSTIH